MTGKPPRFLRVWVHDLEKNEITKIKVIYWAGILNVPSGLDFAELHKLFSGKTHYSFWKLDLQTLIWYKVKGILVSNDFLYSFIDCRTVFLLHAQRVSLRGMFVCTPAINVLRNSNPSKFKANILQENIKWSTVELVSFFREFSFVIS